MKARVAATVLIVLTGVLVGRTGSAVAEETRWQSDPATWGQGLTEPSIADPGPVDLVAGQAESSRVSQGFSDPEISELGTTVPVSLPGRSDGELVAPSNPLADAAGLLDVIDEGDTRLLQWWKQSALGAALNRGSVFRRILVAPRGEPTRLLRPRAVGRVSSRPTRGLK